MSEQEQLEQALRLSQRLIDAINGGDGNRQPGFGICIDAISAVLVSMFLHQDFGDMSRERALTVFMQETFCRLKDAIDRGEGPSNRMH